MREVPDSPWALEVEDLARQLGTSLDEGLSAQEASRRLSTLGYNRLEEKKEPVLRVIAEPFTEPMMVLLLVIASLFVILSELTDALALFIIIAIIASVEIFQEGKAESSIRSLRELSVPTASLIRQGEPLVIPSSDIVPGDIAALSAGNRVPADGRLVEAQNLSLDESSLTGESTPTYKDAKTLLPENCALGDRTNMVFAGTLVSSGKGKVIIIATRQDTELGKTASLARSIKEKPTPLQAKVSQLTRSIAIIVVAMTIFIVAIGVVRGLALVDSVLIGLSLLIVTVPEDLPILTYVILVASVVTMARKKAIIRKIYSAETLGSTTTICSDKTGTLTQNVMEVKALYVGGKLFQAQEHQIDSSSEDLDEAIRVAVLCNDSVLGKHASSSLVGNPVDKALLSAAEKLGFKPVTIRKGTQLLQETPFDNTRKTMSRLTGSPTGPRGSTRKELPRP